MKSFYSWLDGGLSVPQPLQHLAIRDKAQKAGGRIVFYSMEDLQTLPEQSILRAKLQKAKSLDGIVFFALQQFRYGPVFDFALLRRILGMKLEVHFAREGLSFLSEKDLHALFPFLLSVDYTKRRDHSDEWKGLLAALPSA